MQILFIIFICGSSIAPFFLPSLNFWFTQMIFCLGMIGIMFSANFFVNSNEVKIKNIPLGIFHLWVLLYTLFICTKVLLENKIDVIHFMPYFNFFVALTFYKIVVQAINKENILLILKFMKYTILFTLFMCVFQFLGISQFFKLMSVVKAHNNIVTGFLANGTHLSGFLACSIPLFLLEESRENYLSLALMAIVLCLTGTTINDPSISGFIVAAVVLLFFFKNKINFKFLFIGMVIASILAWLFLPKEFFSFHGRLDLWKEYWKYFIYMPITGVGLGGVNLLSNVSNIPAAKHLHLEFYQLAVELGLIGLSLFAWVVKSFFDNEAQDKVELTLKAMFLGFLVSCFFNFPAHLWLPASWALFAYSSFYALKNEEIINGSI